MEQKYISALGHELNIGDWVQFKTSNMQIIGKIDNLENGKVIVRTIGCKYKTPEEFAMIQKKHKASYRVNPGRCFRMIKKGEQ